MTSISKIVIRDCDKQAGTGIVFTNGCALQQSALPKNWTVEFLLSHPDKMIFRVDGKGSDQANQFWAAPYCPGGHNTPLNLAAGPHTISAQIVGQPALVYSFTVDAPVAQPTTEIASTFGSNGEGVTYPSGDPALHPQLLAACKQYGFQYFRLWTEQPFSTPFPASYWTIPQKWAAAGVKVLAVINFQNSPKCAAPSDADWLIKINSFPAAKDSGVWGVCLGNECDTSTYFTGTVQQLAHLMQLAYPILKSKGYVVIAPSMIQSLDPIKQLAALGALVFCDYVDFHVYEATALQALASVDAFKTYCASINKPGLISECGIRGSANDLAGWASQITAFFTGLESRAGIYLQFPLFWLPGSKDPLCQMAPLGKDSATANEPFASAWKEIAAG